MALNEELLKANAATASLTDEQVTAVVEMSRNDEASVIGQKTGEIYGGLDKDILEASGIEKNGTEKTYDYAKRVIGVIKGQVGDNQELQNQIKSLTADKSRLEAELAKGGDAETKRLLAQKEADLANVTKEFTELKTKYDNAETEHAKAILNMRMEGEFKGVNVTFKKDLPKTVTDVLMDQAVAKVKAMNPEYIDDGNGGKVLAFKGADGAIMRNPETSLKPYTANELIIKELSAMGVLETGRVQTGTGTKEVPPTYSGANTDISGAKTQNEATEIITRSLLAQGITIASKEFEQKKNEIWTANKDFLKKLPIA